MAGGSGVQPSASGRSEDSVRQEPVQKIRRSTLHSCRAVPRSPKVGSWAGAGGEAGAAVGLQGLLPGQFMLRFVAHIIEDVARRKSSMSSFRARRGSTALRGAEPRCVGLAAPFSNVSKLMLFSLGNLNIFYEPHSISTSCSASVNGSFWTNLLRFST